MHPWVRSSYVLEHIWIGVRATLFQTPVVKGPKRLRDHNQPLLPHKLLSLDSLGFC